MTSIQIVSLYAGLNILLILFLAGNVSRHRQRAKVSLGTGDDKALEQACRAHGNSVEFIPLGLFALFLMHAMNAPVMQLHIIGGALTFGRILFAYGMLTSYTPSLGRFVGTTITWLTYLASSVLLLIAAFS